MKKQGRECRKCSPTTERQMLEMELKSKTKPRSPLKDLNFSSSSTSVSAEAPRGCFRFLLSNSNSKNEAVRTPKSAPVPSKPRSTRPTQKKASQRSDFGDPKKLRSKNSQKSVISALGRQKDEKKPCSDASSRGKDSSQSVSSTDIATEKNGLPAGKLPSRFRVVNPSLSQWNKGGHSSIQGRYQRSDLLGSDAGKAHSFRFMPVLEENRTPVSKVQSPSGLPSIENCPRSEQSGTPSNKIATGSSLLSTPDATTTTPPLQVSVSPEIPEGVIDGLTSTPACFATGHVLVGVTDKRRCRPRGILTVHEEPLKKSFCRDGSSQAFLEHSEMGINGRASLELLQAGASMHWISSPTDAEMDNNFGSRSPELDGLGIPTVLLEDCFTPPSVEGFSKTIAGKRSLEFEWLEKPASLVSEATPPSSGHGVRKANESDNIVRNEFYRFDDKTKGQIALGSNATDLKGRTDYVLPFTGFVSPIAVSYQIAEPPALVPMFLKGHQGGAVDFSHHVDLQTGRFGHGSCQNDGVADFTSINWETSPYTHQPSTCSSIVTPRDTNSSSLEMKHMSQQKGYRYNLAEDSLSIGSWGSQNVMCTPASASSSGKRSEPTRSHTFSEHWIQLTSVMDSLKSMSLSAENLAITEKIGNAWPFSSSSFQSSYPATPSNSIDGSHFQRSPYDKAVGRTSDLRISWREGLVSRIFEMDELDCYKWLSEEEEDYNLSRADLHLNFTADVGSSFITEEHDLQLASGFGSPEYIYDHISDMKSKETVPVENFACAESMSTDCSGLVASRDSDWTLCYKNQLFET